LVDINIQEAIAQSVRNNVETYLQNTDLTAVIADTLQKQINNVVINLTGRVYNEITTKRDFADEVTQLVKGIVLDQLLDIGSKQINEYLQGSDLNRVIVSSVQTEVNRAASNYNFPPQSISFESIRMDGNEFNAGWINNGIYKNFTSSGIKDSASKIQLEITDDGIITSNSITAENLLIEDNAFLKNVTIDGDLQLNGNILESSSLTSYIQQVSHTTSTQNIENVNSQHINIANRAIVDGDKHVLGNNSLGPQIINSNLRKVGNLQELVVSGQALIGETLTVNMGRVGINTEETAGVLSVWDEDSELSIVKYAQKNMFVGSTRGNDITLGSNNQNQIVLKTDNTIELNGKIRWNGLLLNIVDRIPEHNGEPNEIAILRDGSAIYSCRGQNIWGKIL
jgi:hypothetical protein